MHAVRPFLHSRVLPDHVELDLRHLTAAEVINFVVARCRQQNSGAAKMTVAALRSLLGFLYVDGAIERSLASVVPSVAHRRLAGLPKGLEPDQAQRLLASCDGSTRTGCRDIAILTMLVRLGMRADEVAALRLDDIDWRAGEIVVRGKGTCTERLPLPPDVGGVVAAYLQHGRPETAQGRTVFVRIKAPHRALSSEGVAAVVADAALRAKLGRIRAHRLRHYLASRTM
jgi:site-specific recombinase XerD